MLTSSTRTRRFSLSAIEAIESESKNEASQAIELCIANYKYIAERNDELTFSEGQLIRIIKSDQSGWAEGLIEIDHDYLLCGWFPTNHVEHCLPDEEFSQVCVLYNSLVFTRRNSDQRPSLSCQTSHDYRKQPTHHPS